MRKLINAVKKQFKLEFAPFCVVATNGKQYPCWTYAEALRWVKACNSRVCGAVSIYKQGLWSDFTLVGGQYQTQEVGK